MKPLRDMSIRRKQVLLMLLTSSVALLLACAAFMANDALEFRREMAERLRSLAGVIGNNLTAAIDFDDPRAATETLSALRSEPDIIHAHIHTRSGADFAQYVRDGASTPPDVEPESGDHVFVDGRLHLFRPIVFNGETVGEIELVSDLTELGERMRHYLGIMSAVFFVSLLATLGLSARLQRLISDPILHLAQVARTVAAERNFSVRAHRTGNDELGQFIDGFNEMLGQIEQRDHALQVARETLERRVEERTAALKQAEADSARERARFKFIFDSAPVGISCWVPGHDDTHLVNVAHERITGVNAEQSRVPRAFERVSHPDDLKRQKTFTKKFVAGEIDHYSLEKRYLHPDGRVVWVILTSHMFIDPTTGGKLSVTTLVDVSDLKRAQETTAREQARFKFIFDALPVGITWMVRGQIHTRIVNPAHARISGVPADQCQELSRYRELTHPDDRSRQDALHQRLVAGEIDEYTVEKRYLRADKSVCWAMLTVRCFHDASTNEDQEISTLVDISERKKSETELENLHKQLLETSRQAGMAEVATSVLHNVGNVLNSVNVSATLVAEGIERFGPARLEKLCALLREHEADLGRFLTDDVRGRQVPRYLEALAAQSRTDREHLSDEVAQLRKNIEHIKEIVAMQQSYAKVSGVAETVSLADLVEDALRMNAGALSRHDVNVVREFSATPLLTIEKHKVLQILINLIRNAKYACDDSGRSDKTLTVRITADAQHARLAVIDNGVGIPAENLTRIFAHGFTTRKHGHGFGLHSGALAAREMGGTLSAHSDGPGRGAMFVLELPLHAAAAAVA